MSAVKSVGEAQLSHLVPRNSYEIIFTTILIF